MLRTFCGLGAAINAAHRESEKIKKTSKSNNRANCFVEPDSSAKGTRRGSESIKMETLPPHHGVASDSCDKSGTREEKVKKKTRNQPAATW